jgi:RNA polymerase sigma-70 factor (ECF subfamily)
MVGVDGRRCSNLRLRLYLPSKPGVVQGNEPVTREQPDTRADVLATAELAAPPATADAERALVARAQAGNAAAFGALYELHVDRIYRYLAFKLGDRTEAEDLTEQVFMKALESLGSFRWQGVPFSAWLFRIAHNQLVDHLRRRSRRPQAPLDEALPERAVRADPEGHYEMVAEREELLGAVAALTEQQRRVVELRFGADLPIAEVARVLGKTEGAVKALQHAAVRALQRRLRPEERG